MKALILAGGENKRLPVIKGFLDIKGKSIIESNIELLMRIFDCVIISTNNPECYFYLGVPMIGDIVKHRGPLTGILSALITLEAPEIFVTACDMPFIKPELIKYIVDKYKTQSTVSPIRPSGRKSKGGGKSPGPGSWTPGSDQSWNALIPVFENKPQPLLGIYSKRLVQKMENSIKEGIRGLREFLKKIDALYVGEEEVRAIDPEGRSFVNINTIEDYKKAISG